MASRIKVDINKEVHKRLTNSIQAAKRRYHMKCEKCGEETFLPFRCQYCGGYFCSEHRLPENHECPQIEKARTPKVEAQFRHATKQATYEYTYNHPSLRTARKRFSFSRKEIAHLTAATLIVIGVGLSLTNMAYINYPVLALLSSIFAMSFLIHEISHKIMAQRYGLWAEFRLNPIGAIITLISIVSPIIKIITPGAVMVNISAERKTIGRISIVGPTSNIILSTALCAAAFLSAYSWIFAVTASYNAWIAIFNLVPIGTLDGHKIFMWSKSIWVLAFATSIVLGIISYMLML